MHASKIVAVVAFTIGFAGTASPQQADTVSAATLVSLEDAFWACDYRAATSGNADAAVCAAVYEALKQRKFDGDFARLLGWWQENKAARHQQLAAMERKEHLL